LALPALAQQASTLPIVGVSFPGFPDPAKPRVEALRKGLAEAGLCDGKDYAIALRFGYGRLDQVPEIARELQALNPAVVVLVGNGAGLRQLQPTTPVVFTAIAADPVQWGPVQSYARPGGMVTGNVLTSLGGEDWIADKRVTLFKEMVPHLRHLGMFGTASSGLFDDEVKAVERAASRLGFDVRAYRLKDIDDLEGTIASALRDGADGLYLSSDTLLIGNASRAVPLFTAAGKPTVGAYPDFARLGALMTYGADLVDGFRKAGVYAGKILQGTKPGDLPIEQPTKFTLAINAKTAQQLGISIPVALEVLVDELIE
jgi:putative ABC transport system substrate-binding protein